jgi:hypothetical protein
MSENEKRPRQYAAEIIALPTKEDRAAALLRVPEEWRPWVEFYVRDAFMRRACIRRRKKTGGTQ